MMEVSEALALLAKKAKKDSALREELLATRQATDPLALFCEISTREGCELYPMDLVVAGEEAYAAMRRSTNGGGENSPLLDGEDDYYELFLAQI